MSRLSKRAPTLSSDDPAEETTAEERINHGPTGNANALQSAHKGVLLAYVHVLERVSDLPPFPKDHIRWVAASDAGSAADEERHNLFLWKIFIRLFAEAHIKRKLGELADAYSLGEIRATASGEGENAAWFNQARETCLNMKSNLTSWHRIKLLIGAASPIFLGFVLTQLDVANVIDVVRADYLARLSTTDNMIRLGFVVLYAGYLWLLVSNPFQYKREMFFPGVGSLELSEGSRKRLEKRLRKRQRQLRPPGTNVYLLEDRLFGLVGRRKPRELRVDLIGSPILGLVSAAMLLVIAWRVDTGSPSHLASFSYYFYGGAAGVMVSTILNTILAVGRSRRRQWR